MKNFKIIEVYWEIQFLGGGVYENPVYRGKLLKNGGLGQFADLRRPWQKRGGCFWRVNTLMHTMNG